MIQRVQSIWLLLASLTIFLLLALPIITRVGTGTDFWLESSKSLYYGTMVLGLLCFLNIFNFKKRTFQKRAIVLIILLVIALCVAIFLTAKQLPGGISGANPGIGAFLPILTILFSMLAIRGINKDEQLLRSADRLR